WSYFFFERCGARRGLHSFPTRRSSDLGVCAAVREFAEFRNLLPRGVKLSPEDIWHGVSFVLSIRIKDPQFAGQTKERLAGELRIDRKSTRLNSSHVKISYAGFCLKKKR